MKLLIDTYKKTGNLQHAYLIEGSAEGVLPELNKFIEKDLKIELQGNPDYSIEHFETFTIDDGRSLQERQSRKGFSERKIFILATKAMTVEAQNSLLKVFEEPTPGTHFFVITPTAEILLPTLRSRLIIISSDHGSEGESILAKKFLKAAPAERLTLIKEIVEEKDKSKAIAFVNDIQKILAQKNTKDNAHVIVELLKVQKYLRDRAPSVKLLLEHLALILPQ